MRTISKIKGKATYSLGLHALLHTAHQYNQRKNQASF